jgi:hypothetical protein
VTIPHPSAVGMMVSVHANPEPPEFQLYRDAEAPAPASERGRVR